MEKRLAICNGEIGEPQIFNGTRLYSKKIEQAGRGYEKLKKTRHDIKIGKTRKASQKPEDQKFKIYFNNIYCLKNFF